MSNYKQFFKGVLTGLIAALFIYLAIFWYGAAFNTEKNQNANVGRKVNEIIGVLNEHYVDGVDVTELNEGVYEGLVANVGDRYTSYLSQKSYSSFIETMSGTYAGIGVYVHSAPDNKITVSAAISGSPGEEAGLLPDDKIVKVDGKDVTGDKIDDAVNMLKGKPGTDVIITVLRESTNETFDITVTRRKIDIPTIEHKIIDDKIGYIGIYSFDDNTAQQFEEALTDLNNQQVAGLIIDVRNNLGGYLNRVVEICDMLLPKATIVYREDKNCQRTYAHSDPYQLYDGPIVVITNSSSASASEILAGALRDNNAAVLVGETTFGKGLVQQVFKLSDNSAVKVTVEKYFTPSGASINGTGIKPDYEVIVNDDEKGKADLLPEENDIQLEKAIEVLVSMMQ